MELPQPQVALTGSCSVIYNNTLYSYSGSAFQCLGLVEGAEWKTLASGEPTDGAVCVGTTPKDSSEAALFVVGGKSSSPDYSGLQKFTYSTGEWEMIKPQDQVTKDRISHSVAYLNATDSILVYAGTTDDSPMLSSQTFTISASKPYSVLAYQSEITPPGIAPVLLPWSETQAVLIGGTPSNTKVMLFDPVATPQWTDSGITLAEPLPKNTSQVKATMVRGDDNSQHLFTFDLTTSPNGSNRTMLIGADGTPVVNAAPVINTVSSRQVTETLESVVRRDVTAGNWPGYNSTLAPKSIRSDYSIATDSDGLVVMSGGNKDDVLCMFNARDNTWRDAKAILGSQREATFSMQSTPTPTGSPSTDFPPSVETGASEATAAPSTPVNSSQGLDSTKILGIVFGVVFGIVFALVGLLLWIRHRRKRRGFANAGHARRASGIPDEKSALPENLAQASGGSFRGHNQQGSAGSFSSMALLMNKVHKPTIQRKLSNSTQRSSIDDQLKSTIGKPQPHLDPDMDYFVREEKSTTQPRPAARPAAALTREDTTRRSSGWNRYWSGGSTLNILGFGNGNQNDSSRRGTTASENSSHYSDMNRMTQDSATVPPLHTGGRSALNHGNSGSPTISSYNPKISKGMTDRVERPVSAVSTLSGVSDASSSGYSSGIPPSVHDTWDPSTAKKPWGSNRAPSSAYSQVTVPPLPSSIYPTTLSAPGTSRPPAGVSRQPQPNAATASDMSWLNLGDNKDEVGRPY